MTTTSKLLASSWIDPDWPAPTNIHALSTTRRGGVSQAPYQGLNLGEHVNDSAENVAANRQLLLSVLAERVSCQWLQQVHGIDVVEANDEGSVQEADGSTTRQAQLACLIMTADCLPVLFCDQQGRQVAAAHAGWRGLVDGVLENTVKSFDSSPDQLMAWLGPAIGQQAFEVGAEVREQFCAIDPLAKEAFRQHPSHAGKWLADIYHLARLRLNAVGVTAIYGGGFCTYSDAERFFSYRRDGVTGRMASLIWLD